MYFGYYKEFLSISIVMKLIYFIVIKHVLIYTGM